MRLLEYRQELFGQGYTVISGDMHYEAMHERQCLPMRMYQIMWDGKLSTRFENLTKSIQFSWDADIDTFEHYHRKYSDILLGHCPDWIIIAFCVSVGKITLTFYDAKNDKTKYLSIESGHGDFELRFEVPEANGEAYAVYDVNISKAGTEVIEHMPRVRREIQFFNESPASNKTYIEVTEYAGL